MKRIIPARAGFTRAFSDDELIKQDHPRTRGVYHAHSLRNVYESGSSPHARGLLRRLRRLIAAHRIIPARAGFTTASHAVST